MEMVGIKWEVLMSSKKKRRERNADIKDGRNSYVEEAARNKKRKYSVK